MTEIEGFSSQITYSEFIDSKQESILLQKKYVQEHHLTPKEAVGLVTYTYGFNIQPEEYQGNIKILDAGSRDKAFAVALKRLGYDSEVTNLDYDARTRPDVVADIRQLPFANNTFDKVVSSWAIPYLMGEDVDRNLYAHNIEELLRVTKEGGKMIFSPFMIHRSYADSSTKQAMDEIHSNGLTKIRELQLKYPNMQVKITKAHKQGFISNSDETEDYDEILEITK